jgi:ribosomal protein S18 acetylase RimI-like enzyme
MITLRTAVGTDRDKLFALVDTIDNFNEGEKELAREVIHDGLASEKNDYHILVAVDSNGFLAGFICYGPIPITVKRWDMYWIAVAPQVGRQGIGTLLLEAMEKRLGKGVRIYVDTSATASYTKARSFYERHGYQVACVLPEFYGEGDDKVVYWKEL